MKAPIVFKKGELHRQVFAQELKIAVDEAIRWDEKLTEMGRPLIRRQV